MRFADDVTILRPTAADEYGNPRASWDGAAEFAAKAFVPGKRNKAYFAVGTDVREGDRLRIGNATYAVSDPITVRSPSRSVLVTCALERVEA